MIMNPIPNAMATGVRVRCDWVTREIVRVKAEIKPEKESDILYF
jgi:hypothetical protein